MNCLDRHGSSAAAEGDSGRLMTPDVARPGRAQTGLPAVEGTASLSSGKPDPSTGGSDRGRHPGRPYGAAAGAIGTRVGVCSVAKTLVRRLVLRWAPSSVVWDGRGPSGGV